MANEEKKLIRTPKGRVCFPHLTEPRENDDGKKKYEVNLVFPKGTDISELKKRVVEAASKKWGDKAQAMLQKIKANGKLPIKEVDEERAELEGYNPGESYIVFRSERRPEVRDRAARKVDGADAIKELLYPGSQAWVICDCYAGQHPKGGPYVSFGLRAIQKTGEGTPIAGMGPVDDDQFEVFEDSDTDGAAAPAADELDDLFSA